MVVGRSSGYRSLGVDVEPDEPLEDDVFDTILRAEERAHVAGRPRAEQGRLARLAFCAKEAAYKALAPHVRTILEFQDVRLELGDVAWGAPRAAVVRAWLVRDDLPFDRREELSVRWVARDGRLLTGVALPARVSATDR